MKNRFKGEHKRTKSIIVRVNNEEYEKILKNASESGLNVASYIRHAAILGVKEKQTISKQDKGINIEPQLIDSLKNIPLLSSVSTEDLCRLTNYMTIKTFRKHDIVLLHEDTNRFMYLILQGKVKVTQNTEDGKEVILAIRHNGEVFGEMSLIDGKTTSATVTCMEHSTVALISKGQFYQLMYNNKQVLQNMLELLCSKLRASGEKIEILNNKNALQRVKMILLTLSNQYGVQSDSGVTIDMDITHQEIADMTGMIRETVTKVIDELKRENILSVPKTKRIHLNPPFFEDI